MLEVLGSPELTSKFKSLARLDLAMVLDILATAEIVEPPAIPALARDPKDDMFLATAKAAQCAYLVTGDQDLLVLGAYEGAMIVDTVTFLGILEQLPV